MKLTPLDLQNIFSAAKNHFIDDTKGELDDQQFVAQCYAKAVAGLLKVEIELPQQRGSLEPVE